MVRGPRVLVGGARDALAENLAQSRRLRGDHHPLRLGRRLGGGGLLSLGPRGAYVGIVDILLVLPVLFEQLFQLLWLCVFILLVLERVAGAVTTTAAGFFSRSTSARNAWSSAIISATWALVNLATGVREFGINRENFFNWLNFQEDLRWFVFLLFSALF